MSREKHCMFVESLCFPNSFQLFNFLVATNTCLAHLSAFRRRGYCSMYVSKVYSGDWLHYYYREIRLVAVELCRNSQHHSVEHKGNAKWIFYSIKDPAPWTLLTTDYPVHNDTPPALLLTFPLNFIASTRKWTSASWCVHHIATVSP